jgi:aspartyl-tRNA(Asn)/glutamyl-tRNA(Gln) amidotransferase subunit A
VNVSQFVNIVEAKKALDNKSVSAVELEQEAVDVAELWDPKIGIFVSSLADEAIATANKINEARAHGGELGALAGIPLGIKDILTTDESVTTAQSLVLDRSWGAQGDTVVVKRLRQQGSVFVGKTTTMEFAIGVPDENKPFPIPRNPWSLDRWPGGSSSGTGSGVAVGAFWPDLAPTPGEVFGFPARIEAYQVPCRPSAAYQNPAARHWAIPSTT